LPLLSDFTTERHRPDDEDDEDDTAERQRQELLQLLHLSAHTATKAARLERENNDLLNLNERLAAEADAARDDAERVKHDAERSQRAYDSLDTACAGLKFILEGVRGMGDRMSSVRV